MPCSRGTGRKKNELRWNADEHPRDEKGRFVSKGSLSVTDQRKIAVRKLKKKAGVYQNKNTGEKATLGKSGIEKMTSGKALFMSTKNGFKAVHHFETVEKINTLFQKAVYVKTEHDFYNRKDVLHFKKYETKFKTRDGVRCKAYITIKETSQGGNVFYSVELRK